MSLVAWIRRDCAAAAAIAAPAPLTAAASWAALVLGALGTAFAPVFVRFADVGPVASGFWRQALATVALLPWLAWDRSPQAAATAANGAGWFGVTALAGIAFAVDVAAYHSAIGLTSVVNATFLLNLAPVFVALGAWLLFAEKLRPAFLVALAVASIGVALLTLGRASPGGHAFTGDALGLIAGVAYAAYLLAVSRLRRSVSTARVMLWSTAFAAPPLLVLALALGETVVPRSAGGWSAVLGLALVVHCAGQSLIAYALAHIPASISAVGVLLAPVFAALLGWTIFAEALTGPQALGCITILVAVYLARQSNAAIG